MNRHRPRRRRRIDLHLPDERPDARRQLDRAVQAGRACPPAVHQRIGDVVLRRADSGTEDDRGRRRWPARPSGHGRRVPHRRRRDARRRSSSRPDRTRSPSSRSRSIARASRAARSPCATACERRCRRSIARPLLTMADMGHGGTAALPTKTPAPPRADPHAGHRMPRRLPPEPHAGHAWRLPRPRHASPSRQRARQPARRHADDRAGVASRRPGHRPARQRPARADLRRPAQPVRRSRRPRAGPHASSCT